MTAPIPRDRGEATAHGAVSLGVAVTVLDRGPRCWRCGRKLAEVVARPWVIRCSRCKAQNGQVASLAIDSERDGA
jgi:phage FluMu protein Com